MNKTFFNIPNFITFIRLILIPFIIFFLLLGSKASNIVSAMLFVFASITDYFDGMIARFLHQVTDTGKIIDQITDKILVSAALITLVEIGRLPGWIVVVLIAREFAVSALRNYAGYKGILIPAFFSGKLKTATQMASIICLIYYNRLFNINIYIIGIILVYISVIISIYSLLEYFLRFNKMSKMHAQS